MPIAELMAEGCSAIPNVSGVYLICRPNETSPVFLDESSAGVFKSKNPSIPVHELREKWISDALVIYIGKASGSSLRSTLRARVSTYLRHGRGFGAAHWGGRAIWQLQDSSKLLLAWMETPDARGVEKRLIAEFRSQYGKWPFANRTSFK